MNLGLAVSNDALHYKEPIPDFFIVAAAEDGWGLKRRESLTLNFPALIQGQRFEYVAGINEHSAITVEIQDHALYLDAV